MPYSDNLYSVLDEEADLEAIAGSQGQPGPSGSGIAPTGSQRNPYVGYASAHASQEVLDLGDQVDEEDSYLLSPTDGYFGSVPGAPSNASGVAVSSNVPFEPNVWVEDQRLERSTAEAKVREAEEERLRARRELSDHANRDNADGAVSTTAASGHGSMSPYSLPSAHQDYASQSGWTTYYGPSSSSTTSRFHSTTTPTSYTAYVPRRVAYHGEHVPPLPTEAPPAYTPSPTSSSSEQDASRNYSTFSQVVDTPGAMGRLEETQGLLAPQPQSMGSPNSNGGGNVSPVWGRNMRRCAQSCKMLAISLVLLLITAGFLSRLARSTTSEKGRSPDMTYPDVDHGFSWDAKYTCKDDQIVRPTETFDVSFDPDSSLTVVQKIHDDDGHGWSDVQVQGAVVLRRSGSDTPGSAVVVEAIVNDDSLTIDTSWDAEYQTLVVTVPRRLSWDYGNQRPCINVKITVWVPEDGALDKLKVDTVHLDIRLLDNLSLSVLKHTKLSSIVGSAISALSVADSGRIDNVFGVGAPEDFPFQPGSFRFRSRFIEVKTTAAPIKGSWPLYDYLGLQSTSGAIKVYIEPKEADRDAPKPAILYIQSFSGNVEFREPIYDAADMFGQLQALNATGADATAVDGRAEQLLPPRDYSLDVHTTSGDISGAAAFSSTASFRSTSGDLSVDLLPVLDRSLTKADAKAASLQTSSTSGKTNVRVLEPLWVDSLSKSSADGSSYSAGLLGAGDSPPPLRCLYGKHRSTSADIQVTYPGSWEGDIELSSLTGDLKVAGDGVKLIKAGSEWPGINKSLLARKGEKGAGAKLKGESTSGDVDVVVGEPEGVRGMDWLRLARGN